MHSKFIIFTLIITIFSFFILKINSQVNDNFENLVVKTSNGKLQGSLLKSRNGDDYYAFLGVPFGNAKRFEVAEPYENWDGIRNATEFGDECIQKNLFGNELKGSEDCLTINIYVPSVEGVFPVLVWLHGGGFMFGSGNLYTAKYFMDFQNVVLVTVNYRLSMFGFLDTQDGTLEANLGLKDQLLALQYVKQNIHAFKGNPNLVTLFGSSAGAASVHLHMLSPTSKGLFQRAISQSGSSLGPWLIQRTPKENAIQLGKYLDCPTETSVKLVECLKSKNALDILKTLDKFKEGTSASDLNFVFTPSIESPLSSNKIIPECPLKLMEDGQFHNDVDWIVGFNKNDGVFNLGPLLEKDNFAVEMSTNWDEIAPWLLLYKYDTEDINLKKVAQKIRNFYFENFDGNSCENPTKSKDINEKEFLKSLTMSISDRWTVLNCVKSMKLWSKQASVYPYVFSFPGDFSYVNGIFRVKNRYDVGHLDELQYLFNGLYKAPEYENNTDIGQFSQKFVQLWISFATDGIPKADGVGKWVTVNRDGPLELFEIKESSEMTAVEKSLQNRMDFWKALNLSNCPTNEHTFSKCTAPN